MDILRLYQDYGIPIAPEEDKHHRYGWVNTECPFCSNLPGSNPGYHLGWNEDEEYFYCWRCGWKPPIKTIATLLNIKYDDANQLLIQYGVNRSIRAYKKVKDKQPFTLPIGTKEMLSSHRKYLNGRGFNSYKIEKLWGIKATGPIGKLGNNDYRFRIVIPFYWNGEIVSFDSRDITDKQPERYKACPKEREIIEHKKIVYGNQEYWESTGIGVEGPTDVWRLGPRSVATSGIAYRPEQVRLIAQSFKRFAVIFDDESQAQKQARKLVAELKFRGVDAWNVKIKGDPGSLKQHEADELVKTILK
jgi:hypothetical protein